MSTVTKDKRRYARWGVGATVSAEFARAQARGHFVMAMAKLAPHVVESLLEPDGVRLADENVAARERWRTGTADSVADANRDAETPLDSIASGKVVGEKKSQHPMYRDVLKTAGAMDAHIQAWQERHHLEGQWIAEAAETTLWRAAEGQWMPHGYLMLPCADAGADIYGDLEVSTVKTEKPFRFRWIPEHRVRVRSVFLDDLKYPLVIDDENPEQEWEDEGDFGTFSSRGETVDIAVKRMMPVLETRLRMALQRMVREDIADAGGIPTPELRTSSRFEWLVRYQVHEASYNGIARTAGVHPKNVREAVMRAAYEIGIQLRRSGKGGRPRKS